ncbi:MAG: type VI protein secretion system component Hcp [Verrucomicrobiales bacterium]|jgi:type VI protein secretion system component Hcp
MKTHSITKFTAPFALAGMLVGLASPVMASAIDALLIINRSNVRGESVEVRVPVQSVVHKFSRHPKTGKLTQLLTFKRTTDEASPLLVRTFLNGAVVKQVIVTETSDDETVVERETINLPKRTTIVSYSRTVSGPDDGTEEFGVEREMKESGEKGGNAETTWKIEPGE